MSEGLTFGDYQLAADGTAIYPEAGTGGVMALAYVALGLGESGEVQGKVKKILRDSGGVINDEQRKMIAYEVGDILWYCARMAEELDISLEDIAQANIDKLYGRKTRGVLGGSGDLR